MLINAAYSTFFKPFIQCQNIKYMSLNCKIEVCNIAFLVCWLLLAKLCAYKSFQNDNFQCYLCESLYEKLNLYRIFNIYGQEISGLLTWMMEK